MSLRLSGLDREAAGGGFDLVVLADGEAVVGEALLAHLDRLDGIRESWRPVLRARSVAGVGGGR